MSFEPGSFIFAIIAFGILYFLLNKYAFGPLFGIMEKRRQLILDQMNQAEASRAEAQQFLEQQQEELQKTRKEAYELMEQARATSSKQADEIVAQAKAEAERLKENALREIESEKNKAVAALRSQVSAMSIMIASKIIEKQIDEKSQQELIDQYLQKSGDQL